MYHLFRSTVGTCTGMPKSVGCSKKSTYNYIYMETPAECA